MATFVSKQPRFCTVVIEDVLVHGEAHPSPYVNGEWIVVVTSANIPQSVRDALDIPIFNNLQMSLSADEIAFDDDPHG